MLLLFHIYKEKERGRAGERERERERWDRQGTAFGYDAASGSSYFSCCLDFMFLHTEV